MKDGLYINGEFVPKGPKWKPPPNEPKPRIFDHFVGGEPEDARFSKVARAMKSSPFWSSMPEWTEPPMAAGEIDDDR